MADRLEIQDKRFGLLTAVEELSPENGKRKWRLLCDCGKERIALQKAFASGGTMRSCGCAINKPQLKHGLSKSPEYRSWINMKTRCYDASTPYYPGWGGRGIRVCDRWLNSFPSFLEDVGKRPSKRHSLDRIDVNGNYAPDNVRWAVPETQGRNKRDHHFVEVDGHEITLAEAADRAPVPYNTVLYRLKRGWSVKNAISFPSRKGFRPHA